MAGSVRGPAERRGGFVGDARSRVVVGGGGGF